MLLHSGTISYKPSEAGPEHAHHEPATRVFACSGATQLFYSSVPCQMDRRLMRTRKVIKDGFSPMGGVWLHTCSTYGDSCLGYQSLF